MTSREHIAYLIKGAAERTATGAELLELINLLKDDSGDVTAQIEILLKEYKAAGREPLSASRIEDMANDVLHADIPAREPGKIRVMRAWYKVAAAAVIVLLLSVGGYFYFKNDTEKQIAKTETQQQYKNDVAAPQTNKAILTLSDGTTIVLDSAGNGSLAVQGNVNVVKTADGQIVYKGDATEIKYNTLTVPKGSKPVQLQLADGSNVWLNVASYITYPTAFINKERKVQITGEAYFEVTKNATKKFLVVANGVTTEVLGTRFNVNSYADEAAVKVTLLEGSVKVYRNEKNVVLKPGQQAILQQGPAIKIVNADVDLAVAWKNGFTKFKSTDIKSIMRQVERWYDIDVVYEGNISQRNFTGGVSRDANLSELLTILELSNIHCRIEGKRLVVMQ